MLPAPAPEALAASAALRARISAEILDHGGWITFARYMELALYEPGLGYYAGGAQKLGATGDFVTAPEMGHVFGRVLARQIGELTGAAGRVLEFGAGSGALAQTLVEALGCEYEILETSPALQAVQRARLGGSARWTSRLPRGFRGVMLANEVLDAMPVHALAWRVDGVLERGVTEVEGALRWAERAAAGEVLAASRAIEVPTPYESELGLAGRAWMRSLAESLEEGVILVIDYGFPRAEYYHPQRSMGTLMCHYRHRAHGDVFFHPGLQDITAHVDFTALADAAHEAGLEVLGYTTQGQFLVNCGITEVLGQVNAENALHYAPLAAEANRLLSPSEMGELFKVLAVGRGVKQALSGFSRGDRSHTL
jgi:SAM-dependent MidA family methyltransferase